MSGGIEAMYCYGCATKGMIEMDGADYRSTFDKKNLYYSTGQFAKTSGLSQKKKCRMYCTAFVRACEIQYRAQQLLHLVNALLKCWPAQKNRMRQEECLNAKLIC